MKIKTAEEYVINKLFETENTLENTQKELLKAKETIRKLREGIDAIAEIVSLHEVYKSSEIETIFRIDFDSIESDNPAYYTILSTLKTSEKFYIDEWWSDRYGQRI